MLLHQILHERSKLQLMRAKQQRLLVSFTFSSSFWVFNERVLANPPHLQGKLQKLSQGNQESQMLKQNFLSQLRRGAQADILGLQNFVHVKQRDEVIFKLSLGYSLSLAYDSLCQLVEWIIWK